MSETPEERKEAGHHVVILIVLVVSAAAIASNFWVNDRIHDLERKIDETMEACQ